MICPLCQFQLTPPLDLEEAYQLVPCIGCRSFSISFWDNKIESESAFVDINFKRYQITFDRINHNTKILLYDYDIEHISTIPEIKEIPDLETLTAKLKLWLIFQ